MSVDISLYRADLREIEQRIESLRPDCIVMGLGPSAWLLPHIRKPLLEGVQLFGCNDGERIIHLDYMSLFDPPMRVLHPSTERHKWIVKARPKRLFLYNDVLHCKQKEGKPNVEGWDQYLAPEVIAVSELVDLRLMHPCMALDYGPTPLRDIKTGAYVTPPLESNPVSHSVMSPTGCTTLAWNVLGMRRIGVIGVDLIQHNHGMSTQENWRGIGFFFQQISQQAAERGGRILSLSPFSAIDKAFGPACPHHQTEFASTSAPTSG